LTESRTRESRLANSSTMRTVPSVEWSSLTITSMLVCVCRSSDATARGRRSASL